MASVPLAPKPMNPIRTVSIGSQASPTTSCCPDARSGVSTERHSTLTVCDLCFPSQPDKTILRQEESYKLMFSYLQFLNSLILRILYHFPLPIINSRKRQWIYRFIISRIRSALDISRMFYKLTQTNQICTILSIFTPELMAPLF